MEFEDGEDATVETVLCLSSSETSSGGGIRSLWYMEHRFIVAAFPTFSDEDKQRMVFLTKATILQPEVNMQDIEQLSGLVNIHISETFSEPPLEISNIAN